MAIQLSQTSLGAILSIFNVQVPPDGPKALPLSIDFSQGSLYSLDYGNMQQRGFFSMLQTIFIDASLTDQSVTVTVQNTGQNITVKGRTQGYYQVASPNPIQLKFSCSGLDIVNVVLFNTPMLPAQWATQ